MKMFRWFDRLFFYHREKKRTFQLLGTRLDMLEVKRLNKENFVKEKTEKNHKYKWVVMVKPKTHKEVNDFEI